MPCHAIKNPSCKFTFDWYLSPFTTLVPRRFYLFYNMSECSKNNIEDCIYLDEANIVGLFSEALTANVEAIFSDKTSLMGANSATIIQLAQTCLNHKT
jgi:hypothetical protein